ncbi:MAG: MucBP domain-containing protein [Eubacteriales bacterium]|nr:MucBP domain-containing protein [Eubacteriales bacterium]
MKKFLLLSSVLLLLISMLAVPAYAETKNSSGWNVNFTGNEMISNFSSSVFDELFMSIEPGDDALVTIQLKNSSGDQTMWYMHNEAIQSLEDSILSAEGGLYTYKLTYINPSGKVTTLYDSDRVGGERDTHAALLPPEGLNQISDKMKDYFYLDTLSANQSGSVCLYVALEGETQGNSYQNTLASLEAQFAVEKVPTSENVVKKVVRVPYSTRPKTADSSNVFTFLAAALVSAAGIVSVLSFKRGRTTALVLALCALIGFAMPGREAAADENYDYVVSVYSGNVGTFSEGKVRQIRVSPGNTVNLGNIDSAVQLPANSKYYIKGVRLSGRDNSEKLSNLAFNAQEDAMYCVAYGVKGNTTNYTVNYVDTSGKALYSSKTLIGNVGDKPVVAYLYIDGYQPNTHNLTKTLVADASKNVFTFTYTPITTNTVTREDVTYEYTGTTTTTDTTGTTTNTNTGTNTNTNTGTNTNTNTTGTDENPQATEAPEATPKPELNTIPIATPEPTPAPTPVPVVHDEPIVVEEPQIPAAVPDIIDLDPEPTPTLVDVAEMDVPLAQLQMRADEGDEAAKNALLLRYCLFGVLALLGIGIVLLLIFLFKKKNSTREVVMASDGGRYYSEQETRYSQRSRNYDDPDFDGYDVSSVDSRSYERTTPPWKDSSSGYDKGFSDDDFDVEKLFNRKDL